MCVYAASHRMVMHLALLIWLKLLFQHGKFKVSPKLKRVLADLLNYKDPRSIDQLLIRLQENKWIIYNTATGYYYLKSFKRLKTQHGWKSDQGAITYPGHLKSPMGYVGGAIYSYLYSCFRWKEQNGRFVSLLGDTFTNFPPSSKDDPFKPVATTGINALFPGISITLASRMKRAAQKAGLLEVKKNYASLNLDSSARKAAVQHFGYALKKGGSLYLQQIDTILPVICLRKRKYR